MKVYAARHGQTNYNKLEICNLDPPDPKEAVLDEVGMEQSEKLAEKLRDINFDIIYVSEAKRTKQTAEIINKYHQAAEAVDKRINDNRTGLPGMPKSEYFAALDESDNSWTLRIGDGESLEDVSKRAVDFIEDLKTKDYKTVLVVTSDIIIQFFYAWNKKIPLKDGFDFPVPNATYIEFDI